MLALNKEDDHKHLKEFPIPHQHYNSRVYVHIIYIYIPVYI